MKTADSSSVARRAGLILGIALSAIWLFILIASLVAGDEYSVDDEEAEIQGAVLAALALAAIAGFLVSLRWTRPGGLLTLAVGCLLCVFALVTAGRNHWLAVLVSGVPWMVVGVLTLLGARRRDDPAAPRRVGDGPDAV